jgi:hypothetical protein
MNKTKIGIFLSLMLVLGFCSSCKEQKSNNKLLLNEGKNSVQIQFNSLVLQK